MLMKVIINCNCYFLLARIEVTVGIHYEFVESLRYCGCFYPGGTQAQARAIAFLVPAFESAVTISNVC